MCYRIALQISAQLLEDALRDASGSPVDVGDCLQDIHPGLPASNISAFPSVGRYPMLPILTERDVLTVAAWGLVPPWAHDPVEFRAKVSTANARAETARTLRTFRGARRGLLPVTGFYEWRHEGKRKIPHLVTATDPVLTLGTLCEEWIDRSTGEVLRSFAILTTAANELMAYVHNSKLRMPVVIRPGDRAEWLESDASFDRMTAPLNEGYLAATEIDRVR